MSVSFPVIDPIATGQNIVRLRTARGLSVRDLQAFFGFEQPQAIYKWQSGKSLPSVDNLFALGAILEVPLDEILAPAKPHLNIISSDRQAESCRSAFLIANFTVTLTWVGEMEIWFQFFCCCQRINRLFEIRQESKIASANFILADARAAFSPEAVRFASPARKKRYPDN